MTCGAGLERLNTVRVDDGVYFDDILVVEGGH
jgi:hypothetical protein